MDTSFTDENNSKAKLRWGTMALAVEMVFTLHGTTTAACPTVGAGVNAAAANTVYNRPANCPSWNLVGALIDSITLRISGTEIYKCTAGHYLEEFTARLLARYGHDALESRSDMLFTPICTHRYTVGTPRAVGAAAVAPGADHFHDIVPLGAGHLSTPFASQTIDGGNVTHTLASTLFPIHMPAIQLSSSAHNVGAQETHIRELLQSLSHSVICSLTFLTAS